jgi:serine/threonine protein kinase
MLIGVTPFFNRNKNMLLTKIKNSKVVFPDRKKYRIDYSDDVMDIILRLLIKDKDARLGATDDYKEVLAHPWFSDINIDELLLRKVDPPFKPSIGGADYTKFFNTETGANAISDTYIPSANRIYVKQNQDMFQNFDSKKK